MSSNPDGGVTLIDAPERARAKQIEMLQIDLEHSAKWVETMRALVALELDDHEFTSRRMIALHEWERSRKRAQKNLHYKYDPVKRKRDLVERDIERTIRKARKLLGERQAKFDAAIEGESDMAHLQLELAQRIVDVAAADEQSARVVEVVEAAAEPIEPPKPIVDHPGLAGLSESLLEMLHSDLDGMDLTTSTDDEILEQYVMAGVPAEAAQFYVDLVNGTNQVEA